ncbi:hypothetical protein RB614_43640 [Phytohabitans sp. ZYX-F-186]|uniref:Secreted protein n=1 Tax=Phytohabitans maris TaxID=3071409 RepID=A0ABU0ZBF1_9ACTN|nr:hypothetical protein [Phytohabitans sp. ZYX-F-186]MDQ7904375.1 hypothetical protein [Phytohabitans sp. ZYX-F-186]MDQ7911402.1 hypothetical protein [Phytohabitans sp. ZYX-F-186]
MNTMLRKTVTAVAGFAFAGGALLGPSTAALASPAHGTQGAPAVVSVAQVKADKPGMDKLVPHGVQGEQSYFALSGEQVDNAEAIIAATKKAGMDERAAVVAIATSLQESKLVNLGHLGDVNDHDSLGLFQQRPSSGWGSPEQITDPAYSTTAFLSGLKNVDGWRDMPLTDAAQAVQVSAFPFHYAQWESMAAKTVADHWNS